MVRLSPVEFERFRAAAGRLTPAERAALSWEAADRFVAADTLQIAQWSGLRRSGLTPWGALARLLGLED